MGRPPALNLCIRGDLLPTTPPKNRWHEIGVAWEEDNGYSITIDFPVPLTITSETKLRLFERRNEK